MRVALPAWNGRVSPVFDVTKRILVFDIENGTVTRTSEHELTEGGGVETLTRLEVDVLICSAISWPLEANLWVAGIEVVPDICGPTDAIIAAYRAGRRDLARFQAPGHSHPKPRERTPDEGSRRSAVDRTRHRQRKVFEKS